MTLNARRRTSAPRVRRAAALLTGTFAAIAATATGAAAATATGVTPPPAAGTSISSNWAGYAITANGPHVRHFTNVVGSWVQPAVTCTPGRSTYSAFWVGIGGERETSRRLEQTGTEADCTRSGSAHYSAWYELVPHASAPLKLAIAPGDRITASVKISGAHVTLTLANETSGATAIKHVRFPHSDTTSAEWIAEAPSSCDGSGNCVPLPLSNFGNVSFANAAAKTRKGLKGSIASPRWASHAISLAESRGSAQTRTVRDPSSVVTATPSVLAAAGTSFTVSWGQQSRGGAPATGPALPGAAT